MQRLVLVVLTSLLILMIVGPMANAQEIEDVPHKVKYSRTQETPTGIAFQATVSMLAALDFQGHRESANEWISDSLDMDYIESNAFLDQILQAKAMMEAEIARATREHSCSSGEAYQILDGIYDVEEAVTQRWYEKTKAALSKNRQTMLENWMADRKSTLTYVRIDHEQNDQLRGTDTTQQLTRLCQGGSM